MKRMLLLFIWFLLSTTQLYAQTAAQKNTGGVACPATGSSIEVMALRSSRVSYAIINDSATAIRVGFLSGSSTATLSDSNSFIMAAGQTYSDSVPGVYYGRVVCMSTTAGAITIHFDEAFR